MDLIVKDGVDGTGDHRPLSNIIRPEQQSNLEPVFFLNAPGYHLRKHLDEINAGLSTGETSMLQVFKGTSEYELPLRSLQQRLRDPSIPIVQLNRDYQAIVNQIIKVRRSRGCFRRSSSSRHPRHPVKRPGRRPATRVGSLFAGG